MAELRVTETKLKGLFMIDLVVNADSRGSFREAFQAEKLEALGLPHLGPVQWNISANTRRGILRGIHAEPWDKYIHIIHGRAFVAFVDLRVDSATYGQHVTAELDPTRAMFVSRGFGNSYQALEDNTIYGYLVNAHWKPGLTYPAVHYADPDAAIQWPLPVGPDDVSEKDQKNPTMRAAFPEQFMA
ncbi:MAG: dTDP-4-dehydrorhamnose 3,5-epimerase family protein [Candidatus Kerfeldbacteria bacterium]|nr:dTDP-4-dehydrorhamnose 3,5-epimerase family protein [Candidatus Kerfeldbacteria bacterium]